MKKRELTWPIIFSYSFIIILGLFVFYNGFRSGINFIIFRPTIALDPLIMTKLIFILFGLDLIGISFIMLNYLTLNPLEWFYEEFKGNIKKYLIKLLKDGEEK